MVAVEAMACGTPIVALARGALPEIVESDVTGFVAEREEDLGALVLRATELDRAAIRARAKERFDVRTVARTYLDLYERILAEP